jgi:hypothetical protein
LSIDCQAIKSTQEFLSSFQELTQVPLPECNLRGLGSALTELKASRQCQPILFIDEVDELVNADPVGGRDLVRKFRSLAQRDVCHFVFGGSKLLASQLEDAELRLYNFAEPLVIGLLLAEEGQAALTEPLKAMDIRLENPSQTIPQILDLTSCHPNLIQQAGHWLSKRALARGNRVISKADVQALSQDSTFAEGCRIRLWGVANPLEQLITLLAPKAGFTEDEMETWLVERGLDIGPKELKNALKALIVYSLLRKDHKRYFFVPGGFKRQLQAFEDVERLISITLDEAKRSV